MRRDRWPLMIAAACISLFTCAADRTIELAVDFTSRGQWRYTVAASVEGSVIAFDSAQKYWGMASCTLSGKAMPGSPGDAELTVRGSTLSANFLDAAAAEHFRRQFDGRKLNLSFKEGIITAPDSAALPVVMISDWDLYRNFAKVMPSLPQAPVGKKDVWERERTYPIVTKHGNALGHLFQSFTLDSITHPGTADELAWVSWIFAYRIELSAADTTSLLYDLPRRGNGRGEAQFNVPGRYLRHAAMTFEVTGSRRDLVTVAWTERTSMDIVE